MIIPEYRGYSQLKKYNSDMEAIKVDFRYFIAELTKKEKIKQYHTILFVASV